MGNVTIAPRKWYDLGQNWVAGDFDVTFASSYATSGDTIVAADIRRLMPYVNDLTKIPFWRWQPRNDAKTIYWDLAAAKFILYTDYYATQAGAGSNQSAVTFRVEYRYFDNSPFVIGN